MTKLSSVSAIWLLLFSSVVMSIQARSASLNVAIMTVDPAYIEVFDTLFKEFERNNPTLSVSVHYYSDARYKRDINQWMENGTYDLLYWQGGKRLNTLVKKQLLVPIDTLLPKSTIEQTYQPNVIDNISVDNFIYALPIAQYSWGFYYNKAIFRQFGVTPPATWEAFIGLVQTLKKQGVTPFIQPVDESWPVGGWLNLITLASGGISAHNNWVSDTPQYTDIDVLSLQHQVDQVFGHGYFYEPTYAWKWTEGLPNILREEAAMTFLGQFSEGRIPPLLDENVGFFPLPLDPNVQISALELWVVPRVTKKNAALVKLLEMLSTPEKSAQLALSLDWLPVTQINIKDLALSERESIALNALQSASHHVSFFDRNVSPEYASAFESAVISSLQQDSAEPLNAFIASPTPNEIPTQPGANNELTLGALSGVTGSHLIVKLFRDVYDALGYRLNIRYVEDEQALLNAYAEGIDGEFLRQSGYAQSNPDLIQLSVKVGSGKFYLVCKSSSVCQNKDRKSQRIATSIDTSVGDNWAAQQNTQLIHYSSSFAMWRDLFNGKVDGVLSPEFDIVSQANALDGYEVILQLETDLYHYVHKRHEALIPSIEAELKRIKDEGLWEKIFEEYRNRQ